MVCRRLITVFGLSSACYDVVFFVILLRRFISMGAIQTGKADSISQRYQIIVISMLNNWSRKYFNHFIIKFVGFILICYAIKLYIVYLFMVFSNLYLRSIDLL